MRLIFEGCLFDSDTREKFRGGSVASLSPKAFSLLELLDREPAEGGLEDSHPQAYLACDIRLGCEPRQPRGGAADADGRLAGIFDARRTPEVFLLDHEGRLRYHGRIASKISSRI